MRQIIKVLLCVCVLSVPAMAQVVTPLNPSPGETFLPILQFISPQPGACNSIGGVVNNGIWCFSTTSGVPIGLFATKGDVTAAIAPLATKAEVNELIGKAFRLAAISAALKDAIPNPGDRFAIRLNAAGFSGNLAGAVGFSANVNKMTRLMLEYGRSKSEGTFSGGINLSLH